MVCYIVPLIATVIGFISRKTYHREGIRGFYLNIMLLSGALFGAIDHLWNGELLLIGAKWAMDLALGCTITLGITGVWGVIAFRSKITESLHHLSYRLGIVNK